MAEISSHLEDGKKMTGQGIKGEEKTAPMTEEKPSGTDSLIQGMMEGLRPKPEEDQVARKKALEWLGIMQGKNSTPK